MKRKVPYINDTIAAIATPVGEGGLNVVRLSGAEAVPILEKIYNPASIISVDKMATHKLYLGKIAVGVLKGEQVLAVIMRSPFSYTGDDVVEISAHGGMLIAKHSLELMLENGARLAEPGEFTKRAFLSGKIDLNQAEAVADVISAKTDRELKVAIGQVAGRLSVEIKAIKSDLLDLLGEIEAAIDFSEEQIELISRKQMVERMKAALKRIGALETSYEQGKILKKGIRVVIVGRPNVGKSSLLNCLLREEKAIVTPIPGTTRDIVEDYISIRNIPMHLLDTAGLRSAKSEIERLGLLKTEKAIGEANLILWLVDGSRKITREDFLISKKVRSKTCIGVISKSDLSQKIKEKDISSFGVDSWIKLSAKTKKGLQELENAIEMIVWNKKIDDHSEELIVTSERQCELLRQARVYLADAMRAKKQGYSLEFIALDLRKSITALGEITGEVIKDDVLDRIFSKFCIGK